MKTLARTRDRLKVALTRYPGVYGTARRPYALARFWARRPHDADYAVFRLFQGRAGVFLDVGANAGMSALSFRIYNRRMPIFSIEPNPYHARDLRFVQRVASPLRYEICAAGRETSWLDLYVPVYRGVPLTTEASLLRNEVVESASLRGRLGARMATEAFSVRKERVPVRALDSLGLHAAFIKLDVQGFEREALLGLETTIRKHNPVLLVETPSAGVITWLGQLGYDDYRYDARRRTLVRDDTHVTNVVFVHHSDRAAGSASD